MLDMIFVSAFGIGCGFAGALLLSKGILTSPDSLEEMTIQGRHHYGAIQNVNAAQDWADGTTAIFFISLGFFLQAVALINPALVAELSMTQKIMTLLSIILGFLIAILFAKVTRWHQIKW